MVTYRRLSRAETIKAINDGATLRNDSKIAAPMTIYSEKNRKYISSYGFIAQFETVEEGTNGSDFIVLKSSHTINSIKFETVIAIVDCKQWYLEVDE